MYRRPTDIAKIRTKLVRVNQTFNKNAWVQVIFDVS